MEVVAITQHSSVEKRIYRRHRFHCRNGKDTTLDDTLNTLLVACTGTLATLETTCAVPTIVFRTGRPTTGAKGADSKEVAEIEH